MNTVIKKYGAGIFGFLIVILTAVSTVTDFDLVTILQLCALALSTFVSVGFIGLLKGKWPGAIKTIVDLLGAAIALVLPYAILHQITAPQIILVIIGLIKAAATEFGVQIRTDSVLTGEPSAVIDVGAVKAAANKIEAKQAPSGPMTPGTYSQ